MVTPDIVEEMEQCADEMGVDYSDSYSGRGMFGAQCLSVSGDPWELNQFWSALDPDTKERLGRPSMDSMGRGVVWYWQHMETRGSAFL